jgi:hypothetical protein
MLFYALILLCSIDVLAAGILSVVDDYYIVYVYISCLPENIL